MLLEFFGSRRVISCGFDFLLLKVVAGSPPLDYGLSDRFVLATQDVVFMVE